MADNNEKIAILREKAKFHLAEYHRFMGEIKSIEAETKERNIKPVPTTVSAKAAARRKQEIDLLVKILHTENRPLTTSELCEFMNESLENPGVKYDSGTFSGRFKDAIEQDPRFVVEKGYVVNGRSTNRFIPIDKNGRPTTSF